MPLADDLARMTLFQGLKREQLLRLARIASFRDVRRGETIFRQGDRADGFFCVARGRVKLYRMGPDGRQQILHFLGTGDTFGEVAVFAGETFPAFAEALAETRLIGMPKGPFVDAVTRDPKLALNMIATLSRNLRRFAEMIEELSLKAVSARLARHLMGLVDQAGGHGSGPIRVELTTTKTELAARLGTVSETLSRTLGRFRDRGLIEVQGRAVTILDPPALRDVAAQVE